MDVDFEAPEAQALWRAAERGGMSPRLFEADRRLKGYGWYDALPRVTGVQHPRSWATAKIRSLA